MSAELTYADTTPGSADTKLITLQKILQRLRTMSGGGAGESGINSGHGAPVAEPSTLTGAIYFDLDTGLMYYWDPESVSWK